MTDEAADARTPAVIAELPKSGVLLLQSLLIDRIEAIWKGYQDRGRDLPLHHSFEDQPGRSLTVTDAQFQDFVTKARKKVSLASIGGSGNRREAEQNLIGLLNKERIPVWLITLVTEAKFEAELYEPTYDGKTTMKPVRVLLAEHQEEAEEQTSRVERFTPLPT
jgi:hypothetical protein